MVKMVKQITSWRCPIDKRQLSYTRGCHTMIFEIKLKSPNSHLFTDLKSPMVLRVKPTSTRFPTNSLYTPMDNTPMHSITSVCHPWGFSICVLFLGRGEAVVLGDRVSVCTVNSLTKGNILNYLSFRDRAVRGKSASIVIGFKVVT